MKTKILQLNEVVIDDECYPRIHSDFVTIARYHNALKSGNKFPPIIVSKLDGKYYLVDGFHRLKSNKNINTHIAVEVLNLKNKEEIFLEAIKRNVTHGKQFSTSDVTQIIITLEKMDLSPIEISSIIRIPADSLTSFVAKRMTRIVGTDEIVPLKPTLRHLAGTEQGVDFREEQIPLGTANQRITITTFLHLLERDWFNLNDKIVKKGMDDIYKLLNKSYSNQ